MAIRVSPQFPPPLALAALLAGCVAPTMPPPSPRPPAAQPVTSQSAPLAPRAPATRPTAVAPADWRDAPQTPGTWRWSAASGRSTASYAVPGQPPVASLTCDLATRTTILWTSAAAAGPVPVVITATSQRRVVTARPAATGGVAISLPAADPLLDAIAFSRGRFMLETGGSAALYLPAWPELSRVIEDCR